MAIPTQEAFLAFHSCKQAHLLLHSPQTVYHHCYSCLNRAYLSSQGILYLCTQQIFVGWTKEWLRKYLRVTQSTKHHNHGTHVNTPRKEKADFSAWILISNIHSWSPTHLFLRKKKSDSYWLIPFKFLNGFCPWNYMWESIYNKSLLCLFFFTSL